VFKGISVTFTVDITQIEGLREQLEAYGESVKGEVAIEGAAGMAKVIYDEARLNASRHHKSGLLESAIYRVYAPEKSKNGIQLYRVSWNHMKAPHGHLIEFGTSRAPAYPFIRPSAARIPDAIEQGKARMQIKLSELEVGSVT